MLGLFSNKSDHPLANLMSAQQLLDNLPKADAVKVLREIGEWIEALFDPANEFRLDHQYAVLRLLDDAAHPYLRRIIYSYFAVLPPAAFQESRLWEAMNSYFARSELGYLHLLAGLRNKDKGSSSIRSHLALVCARGIYATSGRLECAAVRYEQIDPKIWVHVAEFYAYAEEQDCLDDQLAVYSGLGESTSVRRLFASLLMWYTAGVGSFRPLELHIAKRLIMHMSLSFVVEGKCGEESLFTFDLAHPSAPARVKEGGAMYPASMRFVDIGTAPKQFEDMIRTLGKGLVPEELNMGVAYSAKVVAEVASLLAACCQLRQPQRRNMRRKIKVNLNVANGFSSMAEQTAVDLYLDNTPSETWEVEDISATGFSCVLPAARASNVKIGVLVGLQPEKISHWGAGVVRRLSRDAQNNLHVGVEMLASKVQGVVLHAQDGMNADAGHQALLLDKPDAQNGESWMLMKAGTYSGTSGTTMMMDYKRYFLQPLALLEKGADYDFARYQMVAQAESGEDVY